MKKMMMVLLLLLAAMALPAGAATTDNLKVPQWVGHEFVTLNLPDDRRDHGYEMYVGNFSAAELRGDAVEKLPHLPYLNHNGKRLKVTQVAPANWQTEDYYIVSLTEVDSGLQLTARTFADQIEGIALAADLEKTKQAFLGKTIYAKRETLVDHPNPATIMVPFGQPMPVTDVWFGYDTTEPILLVVNYNNSKAALPMAYSWTNQNPGSWTVADAWQMAFFVEDPRQTAGNNPAIWSFIASSRVETGMTREQVRLSWGNPPLTETLREDGTYFEVWTYGDYKLYFSGNVLTKMVSAQAAPAAQ